MADELIPVGNIGQSKLLQDSTTFVAEVVVVKIRAGESITVGAISSSVTVASMPSVTVASPLGASVSTGAVRVVAATDEAAKTVNQGTANATAAWPTVPNARRNTTVLHRNAITAVDKLIDFVAGSVTIANVAGVQGFLLANTLYYMTAVPGNRWGPTIPAAIDSVTTTADATNTHVIACTIAQSPSAEWYDLFLSTAAAPLWVARITEAQRATGCEVLTLATITAGGSAGVVNIGAVGTGVASSNAIFAQNNAYLPASVTAIDCAGYSKAYVGVKLALTDLRSAPSLSIVPFLQNALSATDYHQCEAEVIPLLNAVGQSLERQFVVDVSGASGFLCLVGSIAGQGAACSIWVQLA